MSRYEFWYADNLGNRIAPISTVGNFEYVKVVGDVGLLRLNTPIRGDEHEARIPDRRIHVYRQAYGGAQILELVVFLDLFNYRTSQNGLDQFEAGGSDLNDLLRRRIIAYAAASAQASITGGSSGNQMLLIARENLGPDATNTDREIDGYGFTVEANSGLGGTVAIQAAWRNVLDLLQDLQAFSKNAGDEVFFGIVPTSETAMEMRVWNGQPGADRTVTSGASPVTFSLERGNLINPQLSYDYRDEASYIYAGGKGQEDERNVQEAEDTTATGRSPFARKEKFVSAISGVLDNSDAEVQAKADDSLAKNRARVTLTATIISTPTTSYGLHWFHGDKVTIDYQDIQFDTIIRAVSISVDGDGKETIAARVEFDE